MLESVIEKERPQQRKKTVYIEQNEHIRNRVKIYEDSIKKNKTKLEEEEYRQKIYEQNRANMRERMWKIKQFINNRKYNGKINEEFYENNKSFFEGLGIKSYDELLRLMNNYDKENEDYEKDYIEKYKKNLKIEKQKFQEGEENGFSILSPIQKFENVEISELSNNNIFYPKNKKFKNKLQKCNEINDIEIIPDMKKYFQEKTKTYEINKISNENNDKNEEIFFIRNKKTKYNDDTELKISSNINDIFLEKKEKNILSKGDSYTENGIPIQDLLDSKIKKMFSKFSENDKINYEKVEQLMQNINNNNETFNDLLKKKLLH